jgi:hypothetical protein
VVIRTGRSDGGGADLTVGWHGGGREGTARKLRELRSNPIRLLVIETPISDSLNQHDVGAATGACRQGRAEGMARMCSERAVSDEQCRRLLAAWAGPWRCCLFHDHAREREEGGWEELALRFYSPSAE